MSTPVLPVTDILETATAFSSVLSSEPQAPFMVPGGLVLKMYEPAYHLCGFGDPWQFWSVHANKDCLPCGGDGQQVLQQLFPPISQTSTESRTSKARKVSKCLLRGVTNLRDYLTSDPNKVPRMSPKLRKCPKISQKVGFF